MSDIVTSVEVPVVRPDTGSTTESTKEAQETVPKSPKEVEKERFKKEQSDLVALMEKERNQEPKSEKREAKESKEDDSKEAKPKVESSERKMKLKVKGQEIELLESEVIKRAQLAEAAEQKFQNASKVQKQAESFIRALRENPEEVLGHEALGINLEDFAEKILYKKLEKEMVPPEERERRAEKEELARYREQERKDKEAKAQQENEQLKEKYRQDWSKKFSEALDSGGLPKTDWTVQRMAQYMKQALQKGYKHIQPSDVVDMVRQDWVNAQKQMFSNLDPEKLVSILGEDVANKVRKHNLSKFENQDSRPKSEPEDMGSSGEGSYGSIEEMLRAQNSRRRG